MSKFFFKMFVFGLLFSCSIKAVQNNDFDDVSLAEIALFYHEMEADEECILRLGGMHDKESTALDDFSYQKQIFISLGRNCECAFQLQRTNLKKASYPFDWMFSHNFDVVQSLIKNKFKDFIKFENLKVTRKIQYVANLKLDGIVHNHDFPPNKPMSESFVGFEDKYNRRIKRFYQALDSGKPIYFIRVGATKEQAKSFCRMIKKEFPHLIFNLIVLNDSPDFKKHWNESNIHNFHRPEKEAGVTWQGNDARWNKIFKKINIL